VTVKIFIIGDYYAKTNKGQYRVQWSVFC